MRALFDKVILFIICSGFLLFQDSYTNAIETTFISLALLAILSFLNKCIFSVSACILFLFAVFLSDLPFYAYLPLFCYEAFFTLCDFRKRNLEKNLNFYLSSGYVILSVVLLFYTDAITVVPIRFLLAALMAASGYFAISTRTYAITAEEFEHLENVNLGNEILMKKRQEDFEAEQDAEVRLATLKERNRIAREIHDNVGHMLSRALLLTGALEAVNKEPSLAEPISNLKETLGEAMENVRESVHDLYDESIDLEATMQSIVSEYTFCPVELDIDVGKYMNKDIKYCVISILKEALSNTAKHSNATLVKVTLLSHETEYQLLIEDNGSISKNTDGTGIGLESMRERVKALSGTIYISSEKGFRIFATIPKQKA